MSDSHPIPIFSGLLEPRHYSQIGNAIWLFLWCIGATTRETERDGETWGIVLGGMPIEIDSIAANYGVNRSTVKRWIKVLQGYDYITTKRAPYGLILSVRKSKKFGINGKVINEPSPSADSSKMSHPEGSEGAELDHQEVINEPSNKDIKVLKDVVVNDSDVMQIALEVEQHFLARRGKGFSVSPADLAEIKKMVIDGIPLDIIRAAIDKSFAEYKPKHARDEIRSVVYCIPRCYSEWERSKLPNETITAAVPHVAVALGNRRSSKQQQQINYLDQLEKEFE